MKRSILFICFIFVLQLKSVHAQYEVWQHAGYSVGDSVAGGGFAPMAAMPDVVHINSQYYMYYVAKYGAANAIYYATSPDMIVWTVGDTVMTASLDTTNRIYDLGGPGIFKLSNGQFRMFYRTAQKNTFPNEPLFHIRSLISTDGINFTREAGVRVENSTYQPTSYFKSASHPSVYKDINGNTKAIITGRDTTMNINSPAGLYTASSTDEGLTWTNFVPLYAKCHDPIVIRDSSDLYHMYTSYLGTGHREVISTDGGVTWPVSSDSMIIMQGGSILTEQSSPNLIADLGAAVKGNGEIVLYSNHKSAPGAWTNIAYFYPDVTSGLENNNGQPKIILYPNPGTDYFKISFTDQEEGHLLVHSISGELKFEGKIHSNELISTNNWSPGIYYCTLKFNDAVYQVSRLVLMK